MTIAMKTGDLVIPSKIFLSSFNFLAFKKLKIYIMTKTLKMNVNYLEGEID
jgi:hypothetical protein